MTSVVIANPLQAKDTTGCWRDATRKHPLFCTIMALDLTSALPYILPEAINWAIRLEAHAMEVGRPMIPWECNITAHVGVKDYRRVRIVMVDEMPLPDDAMLRSVVVETGLLGPGAVGLTMGYGIYIRRDHLSSSLLRHENRHVAQYERAWSMATYVSRYLSEIAEYGYEDAPMELDARAYERI